MNKKELMCERIKKHGENLNKIFDTGLDPFTLCKKLRRLEIKAHKLAEDYCNGVNTDNWDDLCHPILKAVQKILNCPDPFPIFINGDARGYALKIDDDYMSKCRHLNGYSTLHKDWGGYGILAPDFNE